MPRVSKYDLDRRDDIRKWIQMGILLKPIRTHKELARRIGMPATTFSYKFNDPGKFRVDEIWRIEQVIGSLMDFLEGRV